MREGWFHNVYNPGWDRQKKKSNSTTHTDVRNPTVVWCGDIDYWHLWSTTCASVIYHSNLVFVFGIYYSPILGFHMLFVAKLQCAT